MPDGLEIRDIPAAELGQMVQQLAASGARQIMVFQQPDGTYTLSFLPGDPDFPTDTEGGQSTR
jgi:hypothetical protein